MTFFTVLGGSGFIGSHVVKKLQEFNIPHFCPKRDDPLPPGKNLGHIIYCIGLTADFRSRPLDTVEAHVCKLVRIMRECEWESLVYLSSTRVYSARYTTGNEENIMEVNPLEFSDLYNISKLMGESICASSKRRTHVVRLSNVYGDDYYSENFLPSIIRDALFKKKITLQVTLDSEKDYVHIDDVTDMILKVAEKGRHPIYNVASGKNISNYAIVNTIKELTDCEVIVEEKANKIIFPQINIRKLQDDFSYSPAFLPDHLPRLIQDYRKHFASLRQSSD